jgi:DNA ligase D-like protein (predicted ligase)
MASKRNVPPRKSPPGWIAPQLALLVKTPPEGSEWLHEIKYDGYRLHARIVGGDVRLLTRSGLDWTNKYPVTAQALTTLELGAAYLDGELCVVRSDGTTSFSAMQAATDARQSSGLVYFAFDLLFIDGRSITKRPLIERKARLAEVLAGRGSSIRFSDHVIGKGARFHEAACKLRAEGIVSKRTDAPYTPRDRGLWRTTKCLNREEFVIVGYTDPERSRPYLGSVLLAYYTDDGKLLYAGRAGGGMTRPALKRLYDTLKPLGIERMPLDAPPPKTNRFGSPLSLSRVHWVRPDLVCEVQFLTWTADGLLRQVIFQGLRTDKSPSEVRRPTPGG